AREAVARRELVPFTAAQPLDLLDRHEPAVRRVALGRDPTLAIPAAQRVEADPEPPRRLTGGQHLPRRHIGDSTRRWRRSASRSQRRPSQEESEATTTLISSSISPPPRRWSASGERPHVRGACT